MGPNSLSGDADGKSINSCSYTEGIGLVNIVQPHQQRKFGVGLCLLLEEKLEPDDTSSMKTYQCSIRLKDGQYLKGDVPVHLLIK